MNRIIFIGFILVATTVAAFGQINITGITDGLNFATLGGSDALNVSTITQYAAGVFFEISFPLLPISIQPEVLYSVKGSKKGPSAVPEADDVLSVTKVTTSYIDIPILVKYYLSSQVIKPFIFAGPSIGFLVNAKEEATSSGLGTSQETEIDVKNETTSTDVGAVVGVGAKIPLVIVDLTLDARYNYGFTSTDKINSAKIYNRVAAVYLGVAF
ncbi:MAG: porin family protein [Bacteroidota bacterium]|jgi:hypothetical protein